MQKRKYPCVKLSIFAAVLLCSPPAAHAAWTNANCIGTPPNCEITQDTDSTSQFNSNDGANLTIGQGVTVSHNRDSGARFAPIMIGWSPNTGNGGTTQSAVGIITNNGTISSTGGVGGGDNAIYIRNGTIQGIVNNGTITWAGNHHGVSMQENTANLNFDFTNTGVMGSATTQNAALFVGNYIGRSTTITNFSNTGTMQSGGANGVAVQVGINGMITNFSNTGTLSGSIAGISLQGGSITNLENSATGNISSIISTSRNSSITQLNNEGSVGSIILQYGAIDTITNSGANATIGDIYIQNTSRVNNINVANGAQVTNIYTRTSGLQNLNITVSGQGSNVALLQNSNGGTFRGSVTLNNGGKIDKILNVTTWDGAITNNTNNVLNLENQGNMSSAITSQGNVAFLNSGANSTLAGDINTQGQLNATNEGTITGNISADDSAQITNTNTITGDVSAKGNLTATNLGTITGAVSTEQGADITNSGTIDGTVSAEANSIIKNTTAGSAITGDITAGADLKLENAGEARGKVEITGFGEIINTGTIVGEVSANSANIGNEGQIQSNIRVTTTADIQNRGAASVIGGTIDARDLKLNSDGTVQGAITATNNAEITNNGNINSTINAANNGLITNSGTIVGAVDIGNIGEIINTGRINSTVTAKNGATITNTGANSIIAGAISSDGDIVAKNEGRFGDTLSGKNINLENAGTVTGAITATGDVLVNNSGALNGDVSAAGVGQVNNSGTTKALNFGPRGEVTNSGTISGQITATDFLNIRNTKIIDGMIQANEVYIYNGVDGEVRQALGTISKLTLENLGNFAPDISVDEALVTNSGTLAQNIKATQNAQVVNSGKILGADGVQAPELLLNNAGEITGGVVANTDARIENQGSIAGKISATGQAQIMNFGKTADIDFGTGDLNNAGEVGNVLHTSGAANINNAIDAKINKITHQNGTLNIDNLGTISQGIIANDGTVNIFELGSVGRDTAGTGAQITQINDARVNINELMFDQLEYTQAQSDKALQISGNAGNFTIGRVFVAGDVDITGQTEYDSNTFLHDVDRNTFVGNDTESGVGIRVENINHVSGLFQFFRGSRKGMYRVALDESQLSGGTLNKSTVFSSRFRTITLNNLLKNVEYSGFHLDDTEHDTGYKSAYLQAQKMPYTAQAFAFTYGGTESIDLGAESGNLDGDTLGFVAGSVKNLSKDRGLLGFYTGHDYTKRNAPRKGLKANESTSYAGLVYYNTFEENAKNDYFIVFNERVEFGRVNAEKSSEKSKASSKYENIGYNASFKVGANATDHPNNFVITPAVGLNYQGIFTRAFDMTHAGQVVEHYDASMMHFVDALLSFNLYKPVNSRVRIHAGVGGLVNLYEHARTKGNVHAGNSDTQKSTSEAISTSKYYGYVSGGATWNFLPNAEVAFQYSGILAQDRAYSLNAFFKAGYYW